MNSEVTMSWSAWSRSPTDYFLLLMNDESLEGLMKDRFELGGEAPVAAAPVPPLRRMD